MATLTDQSGIVVFEGTGIGFGGLPKGWTGDGANPENVTTNGGQLDATGSAVVATQLVTSIGAGLVLDGGFAFPRIAGGANDPSAGGGFGADTGSLYLRTTGEVWIKTGAGNTTWARVATV